MNPGRPASASPTRVSHDDAPCSRVAISELAGTFSPRRSGECPQHVEALAQAGADLPPILVHSPSMKVVDGMHRLRAAQLLGVEEIAVRFVDGSEDDAFILAVEANVRHGLPLTLADRREAAARVLAAHPEWSDRRVAVSTGLAPATIAAVRRRSTAQDEQLTTRVGRDNRRRSTRPVGDQPQLRAVATGRPPGTSSAMKKSSRGPAVAPAHLVATLRSDPSVRLNARGRAVLQVLTANSMTADEWVRLPDAVPAHQMSVLAQLAEHYASRWHALAQRIRGTAREA